MIIKLELTFRFPANKQVKFNLITLKTIINTLVEFTVQFQFFQVQFNSFDAQKNIVNIIKKTKLNIILVKISYYIEYY